MFPSFSGCERSLKLSHHAYCCFQKENWQVTILIPRGGDHECLHRTRVISIVTGQTLFRSYGRCIAEFLSEESLVHLGLLDLSTCVGLRYG
jgi:hypothetical protein